MKLVAPVSRLPEADPIKALAATIEPSTLGALLDTGRGLTATCEVCLHSARIDLRDLALRFGRNHGCSTEALRPVLQCSVCKMTESAVEMIVPPRHGETRLKARGRIPSYV
jgi:hypothetical protein